MRSRFVLTLALPILALAGLGGVHAHAVPAHLPSATLLASDGTHLRPSTALGMIRATRHVLAAHRCESRRGHRNSETHVSTGAGFSNSLVVSIVDSPGAHYYLNAAHETFRDRSPPLLVR